MRKMCKDCLHYSHCINIPDYPVTDHNLGCDDWEKDIRENLKRYEDAEEQGLLLRLPVALGTICYRIIFNGIHSKEKFRIEEQAFKTEDIVWIGSYVFLTREAAEQKLKELGE